jgi:hypothetical protein
LLMDLRNNKVLIMVSGGPSPETKWGPSLRLTGGPTSQILAHIVRQ